MYRSPRRRNASRWAARSVAVAVTLLTVVGCIPAPPLGSPATRQPANAPRVFDNSDPSVFSYNGYFYIYGSSNNVRVPVRRVTNLSGALTDSQTDWASTPRDAMSTRPSWVDPNE
ncbi:MAG: hypothetical protein ACKOYM_11025, partial [Actinomycetes bacterium]